MRPAARLEPALDELETRGWSLIPAAGAAGFEALPALLDARVIHRTDVAVRPGRALVTSDRALDFHTDHHRADWIAWHCLRQTSEGGETLLADAGAAFASLAPTAREHLAKIRLFEHSLWPGDAETHALVERRGDRLLFYYSFWLAGDLAGAERDAFDAFAAAVRAQRVANFRLSAGDVLVVDNRRILHGRSAIVGSRDRHLVRHWLARSATPAPLAETA